MRLPPVAPIMVNLAVRDAVVAGSIELSTGWERPTGSEPVWLSGGVP
jgi:hypothetical protein